MYEVTNAQYGEADSECLRWSSEPDQPRVSVTWLEAGAFCEARGARLPTEAEWEYTARGPDGLEYPWGNEFVGENVVFDGNSGGQTATVGSRPGGVSWVGAYDLIGNVNEWVADRYGTYPDSAQVNPTGSRSGDYRVWRGGSCCGVTSLLRSGARSRTGPRFSINDLGFRCARDY
jgi:formylglycine-generating enzyme required for sulfatase activity